VAKSAPKQDGERPVDFSSLEYLVEEFAKRWNYSLPPYPPPNYDYAKDLEARKL